MLREPHSSVAARPLQTQPMHRVLVADDDGDMLELISRSLRRQGFEVEVAHGGRQLLERLTEPTDGSPPDLLISDVQMPGVSGLDVLGWMRSRGWRVPVILVTAYPHAALDEQADALGATSVMAKPFELKDLADLVRQTLQAQA
jgi:CheY-like chemotaxis protein